MNAITPMKVLRVAEDGQSSADNVAILGRDIRILSQRITDYCVARPEPIYEDLATLVASMAYFDRRITRTRESGWHRNLPLEVPVYEFSWFQSSAIVEALVNAVDFLTGDRWSIGFRPRKGTAPVRQDCLALARPPMRHVVPFSDGLDSFAQVQLSLREHGRDSVMLVRSGLAQDRIFRGLISLRVPWRFSGVRMRETSYRTRPLVFYTLAALGAVITKAGSVAIGENGQGALGPACLPFADEWWFRSAHPAFVGLWARFLTLVLSTPIRFEQPQLWNTKGEVLTELRDQGLMAGWEKTRSCVARPKERHGRQGCGICGSCLLRTVSAHAAGLTPLEGDNVFDVFAAEAIGRDREGREMQMACGERSLAVRSAAVMDEFASLADSSKGKLIVDREARLIDPNNPEAVRPKLHRLLRQHRLEWDAFLAALPTRSWVRDIVTGL